MTNKRDLADKFNSKYYDTGISIREIGYSSNIYGVAWSAEGAKNVSYTKKFIQNLKKAINFANKLNKLK